MPTLLETNLSIFKREPVAQVFFQPRIEPWYAWHKHRGLLPERHARMSLPEVFDDLGVSMRYTHYYTGQPYPVERTFSPRVKVRHGNGAQERATSYATPHGELVETRRLTSDLAWRTVEFAVRGPEDLKKLRWLYEQTRFSFSVEKFEAGARFMGSRGVPQFHLPHSPYQALLYDWSNHQDFFCALAECPDEVADVMRAMDAAYDPLFEQMLAYGKLQIVNFGENIHGLLTPPRYFEEYLLPFYAKRSNRLRQAGIFTHLHIDGGAKPILRYLKDLPFDGLEALTPAPQGDVTLQELKEHTGDKILLDIIPAVLFLEHFSREDLFREVEEIVRLFHPRLVLGVSDELPEGGGAEAIERVRAVAAWCRTRTG